MEILNSVEQTVLNALPEKWLANYNWWQEQKHPLSRDFPLMNSFHVLLILLAYLISVPIGRAIMKNRKKFELKTFSAFHNTFLIILSSYMCFESLRQAFALNFSVFGNGVGTSEKEYPVSICTRVWLYAYLLLFHVIIGITYLLLFTFSLQEFCGFSMYLKL